MNSFVVVSSSKKGSFCEANGNKTERKRNTLPYGGEEEKEGSPLRTKKKTRKETIPVLPPRDTAKMSAVSQCWSSSFSRLPLKN